MPDIVVRPLQESDQDGYFTVRSLTYNDGLPVPDDRREFKYADPFVALVNGEVSGVFNVLPMNATRGAALLRCGAVAAVAVSPDSRRSGVGLAMMKWIPQHLKDSGVPLASLYPYRETFYARAGFAVSGTRLRITVPTHRLPRVETNLPVRRLTVENWPELAECYAGFGHHRSGVHLRSELMWNRVLNENKALTIYAAGNPIQGYVAVSHQATFWQEQWLSEVVWSSPEGYRAVIDLMHRLAINKTSLAWYEPSDSPYQSFYLDQGVEIKIERPIMFRVCDVKGAFEKLQPTGEGDLTIEVLDPDVPENRGPWFLRWTDGQVEVDQTKAEPELRIGINAFSQAFMGHPSIADLAYMGQIEVLSHNAIPKAMALLPAIAVYCGDFF